ncbi:GTP-dependent dephospho-CoA kinase family protein [Candidatus Nitrosopumilus salaria]|nr:GTP-dependent dephospho-CoA kinase family protein [Candidatus Nitrosopumilus salaria]
MDRKKKKREPPKLSNATELTVDNPAAEITETSIDMIKQALTMQPPVRLCVNGEEDLLVLPVCIHAPENAVVLYGQPNEGLVVVKVTPEIRNKAQRLLDSME